MSLAWFLANLSLKGRAKVLHEAVMAKISEINILLRSLGLDGRSEKAILQLWRMTQFYARERRCPAI